MSGAGSVLLIGPPAAAFDTAFDTYVASVNRQFAAAQESPAEDKSPSTAMVGAHGIRLDAINYLEFPQLPEGGRDPASVTIHFVGGELLTLTGDAVAHFYAAWLCYAG